MAWMSAFSNCMFNVYFVFFCCFFYKNLLLHKPGSPDGLFHNHLVGLPQKIFLQKVRTLDKYLVSHWIPPVNNQNSTNQCIATLFTLMTVKWSVCQLTSLLWSMARAQKSYHVIYYYSIMEAEGPMKSCLVPWLVPGLDFGHAWFESAFFSCVICT